LTEHEPRRYLDGQSFRYNRRHEADADGSPWPGSQIEVQIVGYDNVRTVSQMTFTIYDARDAALLPGPTRSARVRLP
jgi:hypothetical protein